MASASVETAQRPLAGSQLLACVASQGSAAHPYRGSEALLRDGDSARNLADLIHFLCVLHGRYPGVIDHACGRVADGEARGWLAQTSYAFAGERAYLARLAVAAGPVPSTPGSGDSDSAVIGQRHAIEMLALSERNGCALGSAMAVILDWALIRRDLDAAARRFGVEPPLFPLADPNPIAAVADAFATEAPVQRALLFGAQQILVQHYGLWDLLEARQQARSGS
jgi:hypothetical protein